MAHRLSMRAGQGQLAVRRILNHQVESAVDGRARDPRERKDEVGPYHLEADTTYSGGFARFQGCAKVGHDRLVELNRDDVHAESRTRQ
jgi:hypothetical protein